MNSPEPKPEFSRLIPLERIGEAGASGSIEATQSERAALAGRFELLALDHLSAAYRLERSRSGLFRLEGQYDARVVQACVVTLEPIPVSLSDKISMYFSSEAADFEYETEVDALAEDPPEICGPDGIDIGEAIVQQLALALDPYPHAPGASAKAGTWSIGDEEEPVSKRQTPFAALKDLERKK